MIFWWFGRILSPCRHLPAADELPKNCAEWANEAEVDTVAPMVNQLSY